MRIVQKDIDEGVQLAIFVNKIDKIDAEYMDLISSEIFQRQPFFLSVLLGYHLDTTPEELEEIMKIYFLIWEYFSHNGNVQRKKVTKEFFEKNQDNLIKMLQYAEGEPGDDERMQIYLLDLENLKSKALWAAVLFRATTREVLLKMDGKKRGLVLIGINSFIKCFETI